MANRLFNEYGANLFVKSTLNMVDEAIQFLSDEDNDALNSCKMSMNPQMFAHEFRTIAVRGRRQIGHTHLINQLAYDVMSPIGRKYSTIIVTPKTMMAKEMYGINAAHYDPQDHYEAMQHYASEYANMMRSISSPLHPFADGKIITAQQTSDAGFKSTEFIDLNKRIISEMTDMDIGKDKRIDLVCVDCASTLTHEQIDCIYSHFSTHVELFLLLG